MTFKAKIYEINKGSKSQPAYFSIIKRGVVKSLDLKFGSGLLISINGNKFPTVIRKHGSQRFCYGFTVPSSIGKKLKRKEIEFEIVSKNLEKIYEEKYNKIDLIRVVPKFTINKNKIYIFEENKDDLIFWIFSRGNKPFILPRFIPIELNRHSIFELFGFFLCEGFKSRKRGRHRDRLSFSNANSQQILWLLNTTEKLLGIKKEIWNVQILYPTSREDDVKNLKNFWSKTGLSKNKIKLVKNKTVSARNGICIINIYNSTLAEIFYFLMEYYKTHVLKSKENCIAAFRGFSRGDIGVSGNSLSFDTEKKDDILLFQKICEKLEIETSKIRFNPRKKGWWSVNISGRWNFKKIFKLNLIKHKEREEKLIKLFLKNKKIILYKYLEAINQNYNTSRRVSEKTGLSIITTRFYLSKLAKQKYLKGKVINSKGQIFYKLTKKGKEELKFYQELKNKISDENDNKTTNRGRPRTVKIKNHPKMSTTEKQLC